jgi:hypothetical protein
MGTVLFVPAASGVVWLNMSGVPEGELRGQGFSR